MDFLHRFQRIRHRVPRRSQAAADLENRVAFPSIRDTARWRLHNLDGFTPSDDSFGFKVDAPAAGQEATALRLIAYYRRMEAAIASRGVNELNADMWAFISKAHEPFRRALAEGNAAVVAQMLLDVATGSLVVGYMNYEPYDRLRASRVARIREGVQFVDKLLALSESLGCSPVQCPEQGVWGFDAVDVAETFAKIEARLGFDLAPPAAGGGSFGAKIGPAIMCLKDIHAIYTASQARNLLKASPQKSVAEIGGGTGTLAYYLIKAGLPSVSVFDLPIVSVVQAYYLIRSLGAENVWLFGEAPSPAPARVLPHWALRDEPAKSFALFINQDSMPEIERNAALEYLALIKAKGQSIFLSINQEGQAPDQLLNPQSVVYQLVEASGGFERLYRFPHWMRAGYVEELYRIP